MKIENRVTYFTCAGITIALLVALGACGGGGSSASGSTGSTDASSTTASTSSSSSSGTSLKSGYQAASWGINMKVTFPSDCEMTVVTTGMPNHSLPAYYLGPDNNGGTVVATNSTGMELVVIKNPDSSTPSTTTFNICPTKAASPTTTNMGGIGVLISGAVLFNPYDATGTPALSENASYTFTDSNNVSQTASFIDTCNGHYTNNGSGNVYHYHGNSSCVTGEVDTAGGASHIIGVALDGFPVYGGRDINGNVIQVSQLDSCNGLTSATPEFPSGVYHYVLPEGVTDKSSSMNCYAGTVTTSQIAQATENGFCKNGATVIVTKKMRSSRKVVLASSSVFGRNNKTQNAPFS